MPENEPQQGDEKLLILPLGEESKKITQVITNDTARQIIELLADAPLSASDIAERLSTPLTTVVYNLENLESVGLIRVDKIKYSEKGREVKIYAPVRKLIVVVPEKTDKRSITDILRKYVGVVLAAVFASSIVEFLLFRASSQPWTMEAFSYDEKSIPALNAVPAPEALNVTTKGVAGGIDVNLTVPAVQQAQEAVPAATAAPIPTAAPLMKEGGAASVGTPDAFRQFADAVLAHPGFLFLLGCIFVIVLLMIWDYHKREKNG